jgi:hypothetical protein
MGTRSGWKTRKMRSPPSALTGADWTKTTRKRRMKKSERKKKGKKILLMRRIKMRL